MRRYLDAREPAFLWRIAPAASAEQASASRCWMSRPANSPPPNTTAGSAASRWREIAHAAAARDPRRRRRSTIGVARCSSAAMAPRSRASTRGRSSSTARAACCSRQLQTAVPHGVRPRETSRRPSRRRRAVQYLRDTQKADLAHVRAISYRGAADCTAASTRPRSSISRSSKAPKADAPARCCTSIDRTRDGDGRPACCARGCCGRSSSLAAHPGPARRRRGLRVPQHRARASCATRSRGIHDLERLVARAALGTAGPRDLVALRQSLAAMPRVRMHRSATFRRRSSAASPPKSTTSPTARRDRVDARRRAARARARRRRDARRRRCRARRPARRSAAAASSASPRWKRRNARAPASTR